jgi:hypothetical protein
MGFSVRGGWVRSLVILAAGAMLGFAALYIWPTRYVYMRTSTDTVVRIHRFSDRVDVLTDQGWVVLNPFTDLGVAARGQGAP